MIRTQINLPDKLHAAAKRLAEAHEMSLAEIVRRALEDHVELYPAVMAEDNQKPWRLPVFSAGGFIKDFTPEALKAAQEDDLDDHLLHKIYPDRYPRDDDV